MSRFDLAAGYEPVEDAPMTRDETLKAVDQVDALVRNVAELHTKYCDWASIKAAQSNLVHIRAALSSLCACGGTDEPMRGWLDGKVVEDGSGPHLRVYLRDDDRPDGSSPVAIFPAEDKPCS